MAVHQALRTATILMVLTAAYEPTVGGPIHIATVTLQEGFTLLHERDVEGLIEEVQPRLLDLKLAWADAWTVS
jgi:hypothetical protein